MTKINQDFFDNLASDHRKSHHYWAGKTADDYTSEICKLLSEKQVSRAKLAEECGYSRSYISKILNGSTNFTVETMSKIAMALGHRIARIELRPLEVSPRVNFEEVIYDSLTTTRRLSIKIEGGSSYFDMLNLGSNDDTYCEERDALAFTA